MVEIIVLYSVLLYYHPWIPILVVVYLNGVQLVLNKQRTGSFFRWKDD